MRYFKLIRLSSFELYIKKKNQWVILRLTPQSHPPLSNIFRFFLFQQPNRSLKNYIPTSVCIWHVQYIKLDTVAMVTIKTCMKSSWFGKADIIDFDTFETHSLLIFLKNWLKFYDKLLTASLHNTDVPWSLWKYVF
jgi:hypothetical protein